MSDKSNDQGRAFEYACLCTLEELIAEIRPVTVEKNSSFLATLRAWENLDIQFREMLNKSAEAAVDTVLDLEPLISEQSADVVELMIQPDSKGEEGDVRDIVISRESIDWEIGLSVKHNHFAVKHSRLGKSLDFGERWFGVKCSEQYWNDIKPIFDYLDEEKKKGSKWSELPDKENDVYIPLLNAFVNELKRSISYNPDLPSKMVEYLLGEYDFYKVISVDREKMTQIQAFNLHDTLNQSSKQKTPEIHIPVSRLPKRFVSLDFKPGSTNTVELYMDEGWQFSFRIHNASTKVEPSLKFDIQIIGMPTSILSINCAWR